jgi:hypothetical protein
MKGKLIAEVDEFWHPQVVSEGQQKEVFKLMQKKRTMVQLRK